MPETTLDRFRSVDGYLRETLIEPSGIGGPDTLLVRIKGPRVGYVTAMVSREALQSWLNGEPGPSPE